jgi:hypothetical protein
LNRDHAEVMSDGFKSGLPLIHRFLGWQTSSSRTKNEHSRVPAERYPQYDHTAVIVTEGITSRSPNAIGFVTGMKSETVHN